MAEQDALNTQLAETADELESILSATLTVDDFVDLEDLRVSASHPPFPRADLEGPTPAVVPESAPPEPLSGQGPLYAAATRAGGIQRWRRMVGL